jgi:hypothetical protein
MEGIVTQTELPESKWHNRLALFAAIMMTLISLLGAFVAYRASARSTYAMLADRKAAGAIRNAQTTLTRNNTLLLRHYRAYTDYAVQERLQALLANELQIAPSERLRQALADAANLATTDEVFFPSRYLNRDGSYAVQRELAEAWAEAGQNLDLEPAAHYEAASREQDKRKWLLLSFVTIPAALLCFNLSQNLYRERRGLRIGMAVMGTALFVFMLVALLFLETIL